MPKYTPPSGPEREYYERSCFALVEKTRVQRSLGPLDFSQAGPPGSASRLAFFREILERIDTENKAVAKFAPSEALLPAELRPGAYHFSVFLPRFIEMEKKLRSNKPPGKDPIEAPGGSMIEKFSPALLIGSRALGIEIRGSFNTILIHASPHLTPSHLIREYHQKRSH